MITATAPGKLMVMGEHAVLHGYPCLVAAVSARASVQLVPRNDSLFSIKSDLGEYVGSLSNVVICEPFTFILQTIKEIGPTRGFDIMVGCDFPHDVGLGSSSAVTTAATGALMTFESGATPTLGEVFQTALTVVRKIQGSGSGADLAAAIYGGVIAYSMEDGVLASLPAIPLTTVYSGSKEKTAVVIEKVRRAMEREPAAFEARFNAIGDLVDQAVIACKTADLEDLGQLMDANQRLMSEIGVSNATLDAIVNALREQPGIFGAKISGSGLGDCAIGLGQAGEQFCYSPLDIAVDDRGLEISMSVCRQSSE